MRFLACAVLLVVLGAPAPAYAQLRAIETAEIRLVYFDPNHTFLVPHAVRTLLNSLAFQRRLFTYDPNGKRITVFLADFQDSGNAGASAVPFNTVLSQIAPLSFAFEVIAGNDRMNIIMNHELVHVATMDQATTRDRFFRRFFGGKVVPLGDQPESIPYFFLTAPRAAAPRWYHEGIAVFVDTWMAGGLGRAQGSYDEMVFRSMVKDGTPFYDPLGLVSEGTKIDFQVEVNSYLYGARFMTWLARRYSPEQVIAWVSRRDGSRGYYSAQFSHVFGTSLDSAWAAWEKDERTFQRANLDAIRKYPITPYTDITSRALGSVSRSFFDPNTGTVLGAFNYPGVLSHVGAITSDGSVEKIVDIKGPSMYTVTSLAYDPGSRALFYTTDNNSYRDVMSVDPATGRTRVLLKDARIGDLAFNRADRSLWGIRHLNGICTLVKIPAPYTEWQRVVSWPYGTVVYDLDVSPDGSLIAAGFGEISGKQEVRVFRTSESLTSDTEPIARFDFGTSVPGNFVFSPDGRYLFGSSYFTGASNIFRYDLQDKKLDAVSNTETGFFRPIPLGGDQLIVFRYSGEGFVPTRIEARPLQDINSITYLAERLVSEHPVVKDWMVGSPAAISFDDQTPSKPYKLTGGLQLESMYPVVQGYKTTAAAGYRLNFSDPLQLNRVAVTAAYSPASALPARERVHLDVAYQRFDWRGRLRWNGADFYDLFGPTKVSRKGLRIEASHKTTLLFDDPRRLELELGGKVASGLDALPEYQNIGVQVDRLASLDTKLSYSDVRKSLGYVDEEGGTKWSASATTDLVDATVVPKLFGTFDQSIARPFGHSSVWSRTATGFSPRDRALPFANFFFGAFGNNWVDHLDEKRYRDATRFPGLDLNEIGGRNFVKTSVEWNLPPWRFRRAGIPALYASWVRPALFVGGLATDVDAAAVRRRIGNVGGQIDVRFSALSALELTLSAGGAVAFEHGQPPRREAMFSLKILR
jgi:hypothetical protein